MRIDRALCWLRFARTRSLARKIAEAGHLRCNGTRVTRASFVISEGDVLTIPRRAGPLVIKVEHLPIRRGPPAEARACYHVLDPPVRDALAASRTKSATPKDPAP